MNQHGEDYRYDIFESQDDFAAPAMVIAGGTVAIDEMDEGSQNEGEVRAVATSRRSISSEARTVRAEIATTELRLRSQSAHAKPATIGDVLAQDTRRQRVQNSGGRRQGGAAEVGGDHDQGAARLLCLENLPDDTLPCAVLARAYRVLGSRANLPEETSSLQWREVGAFPKGTTACCYMPCLHTDGYVYASLQTKLMGTAELWKAPLRDLSQAGWQQDELPLATEGCKWFLRCYFFSFNGYLYFVGRKLDGDLFTVWKRRAGIWEKVVEFPSMTKGWQDFGIVVFRNYLVVCSGTKNGRPEKALCLIPLDDCAHQINFSLPDLPVPFYSPSVMVYNDQLCVTGSDNHRDFYVLQEGANVRESRWVREEEKQTPHHRCAVTVVNNQLVSVGGYDPGRLRNPEQDASYVYYEDEKQWMTLPNLKGKRRRPYILTTPDMIVVLSGCRLRWLQGIVPEIEVLGMQRR